MIKVLYISDNLRQRFGVTSVIMNYLEQIIDDSIQIDLLIYKDSEDTMIDRAMSYGANVFFMPELGLKNINDFRGYLVDFFGKNHYDIVHSHFNQIDSIVFPIARKSGVKKCISHSHNTKLSDNRLKAIRNRLMCWNIGWNADVLAACSEKAGRALYGFKYEISPKKLIINNGVNVERYKFGFDKRNEIRKEIGIKESEILLGHIGSFKIQKNQIYLIPIMQSLVKEDVKYKIIFVGDGETRSSIENEVRKCGIEQNVIFTGVRTDVDKVLSAIDLFLLPSLYEGLPVIGIEAQAAGLECIFSDTITRELDLTGQTFLSLDEPNKWVDAIKCASYVHHKEYPEIVRAKGFSITDESKKLKEKYFEIIK